LFHEIQVAFGAINICGGLFGGYPANASLSRTNLNDAVGGKSQIASILLFHFHFFK